MGPDFRLQQLYFRLGGIFPKLAVKVLAAARVPSAVLEAGRIADRVNEETITFGEFRICFQRRHETSQGQRALGFIAMNGGKNPDSNNVPTSLGSEKKITRQVIAPSIALKTAIRFLKQMVGTVRQLIELGQQPVHDAAFGQ